MKYLSIGAVLLVVIAIGYGIYGELNKGSAKSSRLPCHKATTTFEHRYGDSAALQEALVLLEQRAYTIVASVQKSHYMESRLFDAVDVEQTTQQVKAALEAQLPPAPAEAAPAEKKVVIDYLIYENDKKDPRKKTKKSKLYEGYLLFALKLDGKTLYKFQVDFMGPKGGDIRERIECAVRSIITLKE
jgi:hypothetical protein